MVPRPVSERFSRRLSPVRESAPMFSNTRSTTNAGTGFSIFWSTMQLSSQMGNNHPSLDASRRAIDSSGKTLGVALLHPGLISFQPYRAGESHAHRRARTLARGASVSESPLVQLSFHGRTPGRGARTCKSRQNLLYVAQTHRRISALH